MHKNKFLSIIWLLAIFIASCVVVIIYSKASGFIDSHLLNEIEKGLTGAVDLSNVRRNYAIIFFAVFGGGLAIWARIATQKQIQLSQEVNRNERFAKATDMLGQDDGLSMRGGLYILRDLRNENPEKEYVRCSEFIYWFICKKFIDAIMEAREIPFGDLAISEQAKLAFQILFSPLSSEQQTVIEKYKSEKGVPIWYSFNDAAMGIPMRDQAVCFNHHFSVLDLTGLDISEIKGVLQHHIRIAKWYGHGGKGSPPELPDDLKNNPEIVEWLENPADKDNT